MIYLDNAATSYPKPLSVVNAVMESIKGKYGNPGRGSHALSAASAELVYNCRSEIASLFDSDEENVVFTKNATEALNYAIKGLCKRKCHILIDSFAHNASYRPVESLVREGRAFADIYEVSDNDDETIKNITSLLRADTEVIIATHQSNICSKVLPIEKIGSLCRKINASFIVDASQSAGHIPINIKKCGITSLCMPGHKGLIGPMGSGVLVSGDGVSYDTLVEGGSGINSLEPGMPNELPERLEAGTLSLPAIAGLCEGVRWVKKIGEENIFRHISKLSTYFGEELKKIPGSVIYGEYKGGTISFNIGSHSPNEVGEYLDAAGICVRCGYHCSPLAHQSLGSIEKGSIRVSFSYNNTINEVKKTLSVIENFI